MQRMEVISTMGYGYTLTAAGRSLLLQLQTGHALNITRIAVGDGEVPSGVDPATLTGLVHEAGRSQATCTTPIVKSDILSFEIEYRNKWDDGTFGAGYTDPNGLTESFWLREYAVFAHDANGDEIMLYYANLGDFPEPVPRWDGRNLISRYYPVSISIVIDNTDVQLAFPANAFITSEYLEQRLSAVDSEVILSPVRPTGPWKLWLQDLGEVSYTKETPVVLDTAPLSAPGDFAVMYDDGGGETITNMTDDPEAAGENDIIIMED